MIACEVSNERIVGFLDSSLNRDGILGTCFLSDGVVMRAIWQEPKFFPYATVLAHPPQAQGAALTMSAGGEQAAVDTFGFGAEAVRDLIIAAARAADSAHEGDALPVGQMAQ